MAVTQAESVQKTSRLIYLDLARIVAICLVIYHHIYSEFINSHLFPSGLFPGNVVFHSNSGDIGVTLFIFISGLGLTLSLNNKKISYIDFLKRRVLKIYPLFWIIYTFFFVWYASHKFILGPIQYPYLLFTLTGIDTYVLSFFPIKSYAFFDWFIGFIIVLYLIFPVLYKIYKKSSLLLLVLSGLLVVYATFTSRFDSTTLRFIYVRLFEFCCGMYYARYAVDSRNNTHLQILSISIIVASILSLFTAQNIYLLPSLILKNVAVDLLLIELCFFIFHPFKTWRKISGTVSYLAASTYAMFLLHHQLIIRFVYSKEVEYFRQHPIGLTILTVYIVIAVAAIFFTQLQVQLSKIRFKAVCLPAKYAYTHICHLLFVARNQVNTRDMRHK